MHFLNASIHSECKYCYYYSSNYNAIFSEASDESESMYSTSSSLIISSIRLPKAAEHV